ncbi:putative membrane protein [Clostridioides difficile DA00129]|nr:putative membrane protein [Clostridioides difficile DA00129]
MSKITPSLFNKLCIITYLHFFKPIFLNNTRIFFFIYFR